VVRGLYRFTRNPMYVGVLTVILGIAALHRSPAVVAYAAVVATGFHLFVRLYEEPHLRRVFGAEYEAYCARVSRWLPKPPA
jgi:protein-S-isoprenylcysteine O-methyltransferase Ste14